MSNERFVHATEGDQEFTLVMRHGDLREAARDWRHFSSDTPFRVPIPEESALRPVRQLPIECDPPDHSAYRDLVAERFTRGAALAQRPALTSLIDDILGEALAAGTLDVVHGFALPVVSHAIALTLGRPQDTPRLLGWGLHVFVDPTSGERRANADLDVYLAERTDDALAADGGIATGDGDDIFHELARAEFDGRALTRDEILGFGYLVLAGGRDTVIASIAGALWHLAAHPGDADRLRADPDAIPTAVEEFIRFLSPLNHIGRTVAAPVELGGRAFEPGELVSLCYAAANRDPEVFDDPETCRLDRRPNRHVAFGHGPHTCLGAPLARMELALVLERFLAMVRSCEVISPREWRPRSIDHVTTAAAFPEDLVLRIA